MQAFEKLLLILLLIVLLLLLFFCIFGGPGVEPEAPKKKIAQHSKTIFVTVLTGVFLVCLAETYKKFKKTSCSCPQICT